MKKNKFKIFKDILQENGIYSQGRIYLLWSVIAYYITLGILTWAGINTKYKIEIDKFKIILDALQYAIALFGGYVFGGKFLDVVKYIGGKKVSNDDNNKQILKD